MSFSPLISFLMRKLLLSILGWASYHRWSTLKTTLFPPCHSKIMNFGQVTLSVYTVAFICPSIPSQSVELFVCTPQSCQPWSLTNPPFFPPLYPSSSLSLLSTMSRKNLAWLQGLLVETPPQVLTLHFRAKPIFILSNISNNFPHHHCWARTPCIMSQVS